MKPRALEWLLEENQPSIRYLTLTQLLGKPEDDSDVESAKGMIATKGWAADILAQQTSEGWWVSDASLYRPKYQSTNWMLLILSDLGMTRGDPRIEKAKYGEETHASAEKKTGLPEVRFERCLGTS